MTIEIIRPPSFEEGLRRLEELTFCTQDTVFRGHSDENWILQSTLNRLIKSSSHPHNLLDIDGMLHHFIANLASVGHLPKAPDDRRGRLEYARHYGVPSPLIDLTFSPYVALFFAYNDVNYRIYDRDWYVVVYAIDLTMLALAEANRGKYDFSKSDAFLAQDRNKVEAFFRDGFPRNTIKFFRHPASWNRRMLAQRGCFLYDTVVYEMLEKQHLEDFIANFREPPDPGGVSSPTVRKVLFRASWAKQIFGRLGVMGITGTQLFGDEGAAMDVRNAYRYPWRMSLPWDLELPQTGAA